MASRIFYRDFQSPRIAKIEHCNPQEHTYKKTKIQFINKKIPHFVILIQVLIHNVEKIPFSRDNALFASNAKINFFLRVEGLPKGTRSEEKN